MHSSQIIHACHWYLSMEQSLQQIHDLWKASCPVYLKQMNKWVLSTGFFPFSAFWVTKMRVSNWKKWIPHIIQSHPIPTLRDNFLTWVECFMWLVSSKFQNACFLSLIWAISRTNGRFWHRFVRLIELSEQNVVNLIAWEVEESMTISSKYQHNDSQCAGTVAKRGPEARAISWNLWCLYLVSQRGGLYVGAPQIMSDQFKFVKKR